MRRWIIALAAILSIAATSNNSRTWEVPVIIDDQGIELVTKKTMTLPAGDGMPLLCRATQFRFGKMEYYCIMALQGGLVTYKKYMITEVTT